MRFLKVIAELVILLFVFGLFVEFVVEPVRRFTVESWIQQTVPFVRQLAEKTKELELSKEEKLLHALDYQEARWSLDISLVQVLRTLTCSKQSPGKVEYQRYLLEGESPEKGRIVAVLKSGQTAHSLLGFKELGFSGRSPDECLQLRFDILLSPLLSFLHPNEETTVSSGNFFLPCSK